MLNNKDLNNEVIVIFGGAGGIGSGIVKKYCELENVSIIIADINTERGTELSNKFSEVDFFYTDVLLEKSLSKLKSYVESNYGSITHLISLAGGAILDEFAGFNNLDSEIISQSIDLNLKSHIIIVQVLNDLLVKNDKDNKTITLISSINAISSFSLPVYSSAKAGLLGFMYSSVGMFGNQGIRLNVVSPGTVITPRTLGEPKSFESLKKSTKINRLTTVKEVANSVFSLTHYMTSVVGQNIIVDAGQSLK